MISEKERHYELDLLRFIAAIAVVVFHYTYRGYSADGLSTLRFDEFAPVSKYCSYGVNFFFMISGYVILLTAYFRDAKSFVISRMIRLYPAYWFALILTSFCILLMGQNIFHVTLVQFLCNLSMIQSVFKINDVDGVYWTLFVEIRFYLLIFIVLSIGQIKNIIIFLYCWSIVSILNLFIALPVVFKFFLILNYAPFFIAGSVFFLARIHGYNVAKILLLLTSITLCLFYTNQQLLETSEYYKTSFSPIIVTIIICFIFFIFILLSLRKLDFVNKPFMYLLGILTYPLYLVHQNIGYMIFNHTAGLLNRWVILVITVTLMITVAYCISVFVERPLSLLMKKALFRITG
jgi:peptidoglycan/LPS O-acetylase OafA/YrhL